jgi:acyl-coenzyme A synthetase/AMP-(fatty) acid ligase
MHPAVAEAATVGIAEPIRGEQAVLFVVLKHGYSLKPQLADEIIKTISTTIGSFVKPSAVHFVEKLPKTRSGKIMRRLLKNIVEGGTVGDVSTLEDASSLEEIQEQYNALKPALYAHKS